MDKKRINLPGLAAGVRGQGEGGEANEGGGADIGADATVDVNAIVEWFESGAKMRLKPDPIQEYSNRFRGFATGMNLLEVTRRHPTGKPGKALIFDYMDKHPRPSWRTLIAILRAVWAPGVSLPWPVGYFWPTLGADSGWPIAQSPLWIVLITVSFGVPLASIL
jgi:hypothetical protein